MARDKKDKQEILQLIDQMTLEEKAGLCSGKDVWQLKGVPRLGIPSIRVSDGPSGLRLQGEADNHLAVSASQAMVAYPTGAAMASSFDTELMARQGRALGAECQAENVAIVLGPSANIKRSPLCGRNFEYLSEDPLLAGEMAAAQIEGIQSQNVGASIKHFACNNQETWRTFINAVVDERTLREIYLPVFETAVKKAKPWTVMSGYNSINGDYASQNEYLLRTVLKDEWGFEGAVVSDWGSVHERVRALKAGLDLEMPGGNVDTDADIARAVENGTLDEAVLNDTAARILKMVFAYAGSHTGDETYDPEAHHALTVALEENCAVLLKNEGGLLPLPENSGQTIAFIGQFAEKPRFLGGGSAAVLPFKLSNALDAVKDTIQTATVSYAPGFAADGDEENPGWMRDAVALAKTAGVAVVFAGLPDSYESECWDRPHMRLPECQNKLIAEICAVQPNTVVVLHTGAPVEMPWINGVKAVLEMYTGGQGVGQATANLLFGRANPSGKLAETFPLRLEDNPSYLNFPGDGEDVEYREGVFVGYRYYDKKKLEVLFPFGHGLSYTSFAYGNLRLSKAAMRDDETLTVQVDVTNTGSLPGKEAVQLYVANPDVAAGANGAPNRPVKELRGFAKLALAPGETKTATFVLEKRAFACYNVKIGDWHVPGGKYGILIGASSRDIRLAGEVMLTSTTRMPFAVTMDSLMGAIWQRPALMEAAKSFLCEASAMFAAFMQSDDEDARWQQEELMELPLCSMRGLYHVRQTALEQLVQVLNGLLEEENA